jgi:hypothetical protein
MSLVQLSTRQIPLVNGYQSGHNAGGDSEGLSNAENAADESEINDQQIILRIAPAKKTGATEDRRSQVST